MLAPRKRVHLLLIISEAIIIIACIFMIILYSKRNSVDKYHQIWIGSKILTVNKIIKQNIYEIYPILDINSDNERVNYSQNYEYLLKHSGEKCEENYKKCGILDTLGNIMCIPKEDECPINEVKVDLNSKYDDYISKGYKVAYLEKLDEDYALYYTNKALDNEIVAKLDFFKSIPTYISENNLIFDYKTYKENFYKNSRDYDDDDWDDVRGDWDDRGYGSFDNDGGGGAFRILEEEKNNETAMDYIKNNFNNPINIDKSFRNVYNNLYIGNYIGYKNYNNMTKYMSIDLHYLYLNPFPHPKSIMFYGIGIVFLLLLIICSLNRYCHEDKPNEGSNKCATLVMKLFLIIPYLIFFIGFFFYIIYHYCVIYNKNKLNDLTKIIAEKFLEDLMLEVKAVHYKLVFHIIVIILFSFSMIAFLLAWVLNIYYTYRYYKFQENAKAAYPFDQSSI